MTENNKLKNKIEKLKKEKVKGLNIIDDLKNHTRLRAHCLKYLKI